MLPVLLVTGPERSVPFAAPRAIALDRARGEILIANTETHRIEVFDLAGNRIARFVHRVRTRSGEMADGLPHALAIDSSAHLLVVDRLADYVDVLDFRGRPVTRLEVSPADPADGPGAVAVAPDGTILVAMRGQSGRIHRFSRDYESQGAWGESGREPGRLTTIASLAVAPDGRVVVVSAVTELAVQVFDPDGIFLHGFGRHEVGQGNFSLPSGVTVTRDGSIWVADELRQVVQVFDPAGALRGVLGGGGWAPGSFLYPSALASAGDSLIAVVERGGNRFQLFRVQ